MSATYPTPDLKGKVVLVTGGSSGIGERCVAQFLEAGAKVIASGRSMERLDALYTLPHASKANLLLLPMDVRDKKDVQTVLQSLPYGFHEVDILVNNAGLAQGLEAAYKSDLKDWEVMVDTNIKGIMYVTHTLLPDMVARGRGHIITIGSIAGTYPYFGGNVYGASKAFSHQFSLNLCAELVDTPLRATSIEPGMVETPFSDVRFKGDKDRAAQVYADSVPLKAEDIAHTVVWVAGLPAHVNINRMEVMPTCQAPQAPAVHRAKKTV